MAPDQTKIKFNYNRNLALRIQCPLIENQVNIIVVSKTCRKRQTTMLVGKWGVQMIKWYFIAFPFLKLKQEPGWCLWKMRTIPVCFCLAAPSGTMPVAMWAGSPARVLAHLCAGGCGGRGTKVRCRSLSSQGQSELWHTRRQGRVLNFECARGRGLEVETLSCSPGEVCS